MHKNDQLAVNFILARGAEIYAAQKRFGADPQILASDAAYFNALAMGILQSSSAAGRLSSDFRGKNAQVSWDRIDGWKEQIVNGYAAIGAQDLWIMLEDFAELYGVCFVAADSQV
ncbi:hypothetical protein FACS189487_03200 [Campylobacterota bacterium]|nr:hypothetical protein FACS189487_03200 [Campylobacterota bacterium]